MDRLEQFCCDIGSGDLCKFCWSHQGIAPTAPVLEDWCGVRGSRLQNITIVVKYALPSCSLPRPLPCAFPRARP
jgi:hypothetical protein